MNKAKSISDNKSGLKARAKTKHELDNGIIISLLEKYKPSLAGIDDFATQKNHIED